MRYSHVLYFQNTKPFDNMAFRYPSFVGEFVAPLVRKRPHVLYWFSFYGSSARFRVHPDSYDEIRPDLESARDRLGLIDRDEEKTLTLEQDLGCDRFIGPNSKSTPQKRALAILRSLKAVGDLMIESVFKRDDGYWDFEESANKLQNPIGCHFFSVTHLYHNMASADGLVYSFEDASQKLGVLSYYYFHEMVRLGRLSPSKVQDHQVAL